MMKEAQENDSGLLSFYVDRSGSETFSGKRQKNGEEYDGKGKQKKTPNYANTVKPKSQKTQKYARTAGKNKKESANGSRLRLLSSSLSQRCPGARITRKK